jgi:hypothetical protein
MSRIATGHSLRATLILLALTAVVAVPTVLAGTPSPAWQTETVDPEGCWYVSMALDGAGQPRIAYGAVGELRYAWHDGSTWQVETVEDQPGATGWFASLALDSLDQPRISYYSPYSSSLMYAEYYSDTWHIQPLGDPYNIEGQTSLALDSAEEPHIAYWDYTHLAVKYAHRAGSTWQFDTVATMATGGQSVSLALAVDSSDRPHLCYYDYETDELIYAYHDGTAWQVDPVADLAIYNGQECSLVLDAQDRPHISYCDLGLWYATYTGSAWQLVSVDDDFFAGDTSSLALDSEGRPHIAYSDWAVPDQELRYAHPSGPGWWIETVDVAAEARRFADVSLALDAGDRPQIGYWDLGNLDMLKYAARDQAPVTSLVYLPLILRQP